MIIDASAQADSRLSEGLVVDADHVDVTYTVRGADRLTVKDISFQIGRQESFGLVGESGCGKTTMALAIARYLPRNGRVSSGSITVAGQDVGSLSNEALRKLRARTISMVYQEPGRALNPSIRIGRQVAEVFEIAGASRQEAADQAEEALRKVQISDPGRVLRRYPHQLSGGMLQRVIIAMALAAEPSLLILDEPTTALDATVEAEILELVSALREEFHTAVLFISHNLAVIAKMCDRVGVMYAGELVEQGPAQEIFDHPRHPYTVGLLRCIPRRGQRRDHGRLDTIPGFLPAPGTVSAGCVFEPRCALADQRCREEAPPMYPISTAQTSTDGTSPPTSTDRTSTDGSSTDRTSRCHYHEKAPSLPRATPEDVHLPGPDLASAPVISLRDVSKTFADRHESVQALVGIDLDLHRGETLGLVGESGSGKTTLARVLLGLTAADQGSVLEMSGSKLAPTAPRRSRDQLRALQIIFQNPDSALNRRHSVRHLISRALTKLAGLSGAEREAALLDIISSVRMQERYLGLRPAQLSGGLKQRVAIARAFAGNPNILVCDEPTSALDVSVQAAILNLLGELQGSKQVTYLFISHDLGVVRYLSDRIAVLYLGRLMEYGEAEAVFTGPHHPYTEALLSAVPSLEGTPAERIILTGEIPESGSPAQRMRFPHPLPAPSCERHLRVGGTAPCRGRTRAFHALPHPAR